MSILVAPPPAFVARSQPKRARWTVEEFHQFAGLPIFENRKMILVDGEVLEMPPANHPHDMGIGKTSRALAKVFPEDSYWVRVQMSLPTRPVTDLVPDVAVVEGEMTTFTRQPTTALLVVEVSDSSFDYDSGEKAELYAAGAIADYWVVDVNGRQLLVFRDPVADVTTASGFRYATKQVLDSAAVIAPLAAPVAVICVADLLPR